MPLPAELINLDVIERLLKLYASGRLAHAYLFTGPGGSGKVETALALAQAVNCLEPGGRKAGCQCSSCRKFDTGNHPDLFVLKKPENKAEIVIAQMLPKAEAEPFKPQHPPLIPWLGVRALEARVRVIVIKDADLLNTQASNAFLKTLEEPCPGSLFVLTSAAPGNILKTVLSRCHEVRFAPLRNSVLVGGAKSKYDVGSPEDLVIDEFILGAASEELFKKWSADKEKARKAGDVVLKFYRDVLCVQNGAADQVLYYSGRSADIRRAAQKLSAGDAQAVVARAVKVIEAVNENFNVKLALILLKEMIR